MFKFIVLAWPICTFAAHSAPKDLSFSSGESNEKSCEENPKFVMRECLFRRQIRRCKAAKCRNAQEIASKRAKKAKKVERNAPILYR